MAHRSSTNNLTAGLFLIGSLAIALVISFWLGGVADRLGAKSQFNVRFPMDVGVGGLQPGSTVTLAGLEVGKVRSVTRVLEGDRVVGMEARVLIDSAVILRADAMAYLIQPILGGVSAINISSVGLRGEPLEDHATIVGGIAPGLLAQLGFGASEADQIRAILSNVEAATDQADELLVRLDRVAAAFETGIDGTAGDLRGAIADARGFTSKFSGETGWNTKIDTILRDSQSGLAQLPEITQSMQRAVANADAFLDDTRGLLAENRPRIGRVLTDTESLVQRFRFDTAIRFEELLEQGVLTAASYGEMGDRLNLMLTREYPQVRRSLANVRESSDQLKLAIGELRSQPWRLLDSPSESEMAKEPLYAAARMYAVAVADLRAASEALETAVGSAEARQDGNAEIPGTAELAGMAIEVNAAFERYQDAEQTLLEKLASQE